MEDAGLIIIIAVFVVVCYIAAARFSRFVEDVRKDTNEYLNEQAEEEEDEIEWSQAGDGRKGGNVFRSERVGS